MDLPPRVVPEPADRPRGVRRDEVRGVIGVRGDRYPVEVAVVVEGDARLVSAPVLSQAEDVDAQRLLHRTFAEREGEVRRVGRPGEVAVDRPPGALDLIRVGEDGTDGEAGDDQSEEHGAKGPAAVHVSSVNLGIGIAVTNVRTAIIHQRVPIIQVMNYLCDLIPCPGEAPPEGKSCRLPRDRGLLSGALTTPNAESDGREGPLHRRDFLRVLPAASLLSAAAMT